MNRRQSAILLVVFLALLISARVVTAQGPQPGGAKAPTLSVGTAFTYQGQLKQSGSPVSATCNFQFGLWDSASGGLQVSGTTTQTVSSVSVSNGLFTASIDFGANAFNGNARYLAIAAACPSGSTYTSMTSRQTLTPEPYALFSSAPWLTSGNNLYYNNGSVGIGTNNMNGMLNVYGTSWFQGDTTPLPSAAGTGIALGYPNGADYGYLFAFDYGTFAPKNLLLNHPGGNVGIGSTNPTSKLEIAAQDGLAITGYQPFLTLRDTNAGNARSAIQSANGNIYFYPNSFIGGYPPMVIQSGSGSVGIGITTPIADLTVRGNGYYSANFAVFNQNDKQGLIVFDDQTVKIGALFNSYQNTHVCRMDDQGFLTMCASAAEYVPSIDNGSGFPETADVVSIASNIDNPYDDDHGPFVVAKSTQTCDDNLLGFIVNPEKGADGKKLNDHYLPLAIYGYFPTKVTTANGAIKRGDALTSSSKAGYAMKATGACRIIGYALEDANADGTIQVFAHLSENTASQVAALQKENSDLKTQNAQLETRVNTLEQQSASLQTRMSALEQLAQANTPAHADSTNNIAVIVIGALLGIVVVQKPWRRGE